MLRAEQTASKVHQVEELLEKAQKIAAGNGSGLRERERNELSECIRVARQVAESLTDKYAGAALRQQPKEGPAE